MAEIGSRVWGTPANFNGFRVLAALLHGTLHSSAKLCSVEQMATPIFGRAAITLGIGPHSSSFYNSGRQIIHILFSSLIHGWLSSVQNFTTQERMTQLCHLQWRKQNHPRCCQSDSDVLTVSSECRYERQRITSDSDVLALMSMRRRPTWRQRITSSAHRCNMQRHKHYKQTVKTTSTCVRWRPCSQLSRDWPSVLAGGGDSDCAWRTCCILSSVEISRPSGPGVNTSSSVLTSDITHITLCHSTTTQWTIKNTTFYFWL